MRFAALSIVFILQCGGAGATRATPADAHERPAPAAAAQVHFAAGTFLMGSPDGEGSADEHPQHSVSVAAFDLDTTDVTVAAYAECVRAGKCTPAATTIAGPSFADSDKATWSKYCNGDRADRRTHPANCIDFDQATAYCAWTGKRLPTEAEWEYAARGGKTRTYPWGDEPPDETRADACGAECAAMAKEEGFEWRSMYPAADGWPSTAPVGTYPAGRTPEGLLDMAGNVWQWTSTPYARYGASDAGPRMVLRGGAWDSYMPKSLRTTNRVSEDKATHSNVVGFRCAKSS